MHLFHVAAVFLVLLVVGIELSVSAFVNPSAWRLDPDAQYRMLGHFAAVLGKVMPVCYPAALVLLGVETFFHWHMPGFPILLAASTIWFLASLASIFFLVPLNNRVIEGAAGWQEIHRTWDRRHRVRIAALAVAGVLLTYALVC
jgi:uncharacterized membrane protein